MSDITPADALRELGDADQAEYAAAAAKKLGLPERRRARVTFEGDVMETSTAYWWHGDGIDFCPEHPAVNVEWLDDAEVTQ